jgi:hypothetical protein
VQNQESSMVWKVLKVTHKVKLMKSWVQSQTMTQ